MCKMSDLVDGLTVEERACLRIIARQSSPQVPSPQAETLVSLGLAELAWGALDLTAFGRRAVAMMRS